MGNYNYFASDSNVTSTSSVSNADVTWNRGPWWRSSSHHLNGWWGVWDTLGHKLKLPKKMQQPICDHYDIAAGIPLDDLVAMDYDGHAPWWLRKPFDRLS